MKKVGKLREPPKTSLREIPEVDFALAKVRRNPYAVRVTAEGIFHVRRGRPKKGTETGPTEPRSIRFPAPSGEACQGPGPLPALGAPSNHHRLGPARLVGAPWRRRPPR